MIIWDFIEIYRKDISWGQMKKHMSTIKDALKFKRNIEDQSNIAFLKDNECVIVAWSVNVLMIV